MDENFDEDGYNIAISHLFVIGGNTSDSERPIQLGGGLLVNPKDLPKKADYIALGHLHKPQKVKVENGICRYSGSPIEYSRSEAKHTKLILLIDTSNKDVIKEIVVPNFKPIQVWKTKSISEAIELCREHSEENSYVYIEIETDRIIDVTELKEMKTLKSDIISIVPIFTESEETIKAENIDDKSISELFKDFYIHVNKSDPDEKIMNTFNEIVHGEGEEDEAN
jgi:exonuclease SbcD